MIQTQFEINTKHMKLEAEYYQEVFKRSCNKKEYIPIVEFNDISTEEPSEYL